MTATQLQRWESRAEWPLAACAVVSWSLDLLYLPFVIDYITRLRLADNRLQWFLRHPLDLAVATLPFLQPLRFLRLVALARILQRALGDAVRGRVIAFTVFGASLLVYTAALAELKAERYAPGTHITTFPDALWWAVATLTTVGYGDHVPVTHTGRIIAVLLMIGGICLIGVATATVAHWIITEVAKADSAQQAVTVAHVEELREEIRNLQQLVQGQTGQTAAEPGVQTPSATGVPIGSG